MKKRKYLPLTIGMVILINCQIIFAQTKPYYSQPVSICGHQDSVISFKQGDSYYLRIGTGKKQKIGTKLVKDSAKVQYKKALSLMLTKYCGANMYDEPYFFLFVNSFSNSTADNFFPPAKKPSQPFPILIDSLLLDQSHFLGILRTTENGLILSEYTLPFSTKDILKWDSTGKMVYSDLTVFNDHLLQQHLPGCLLLQSNAGKIKFPQFYLLYDGAVPAYELIISADAGIGINTGIKIPAEIGDTIIEEGKVTTIAIDNKKFNVQAVKNTVGVKSAEINNRQSATLKGPVIEHQQLVCGAAESYNISAYIYTRSPSDSILFSLKSPSRQIPDTVMPFDFRDRELTTWVNLVIPRGECNNKQTDSMLSSFISECRIKAPLISTNYELSKPNTSPVTGAAAGEAKAATTAPAKKDSAISSQSQTDSPQDGKSTKANSGTDSLAKYSMYNNITVLNAFNFDFTGKLSASYLGLFNIFAPNFGLVTNKNRWGFFAGIEKINYATANINGSDSGQTAYLYQYVLKNPLDYNSSTQRYDSGAPYYYQYNKYTLTSKNTVWSFYFDPTFRTNWISNTDKDQKVGFYWHFHTELLVNKFTTTINKQILYNDSAIYGPTNAPYPLNKYLPSQYSSLSTIVTGNFGAGMMLYVAPFKDTSSHFYFQFTSGISINSPNFTNLTTLSSKDTSGRTIVSLPSINSALVNPANVEYSHPKWFYLFRAAFFQSLSNKTELIIGMTIRGLLPSQTPQYAAYIGLNLDLNILSDLFSSK